MRANKRDAPIYLIGYLFVDLHPNRRETLTLSPAAQARLWLRKPVCGSASLLRLRPIGVDAVESPDAGSVRITPKNKCV